MTHNALNPAVHAGSVTGTGPLTLVRKLIDSARRGEMDYEGRPPPKVDWTAYDLAQTRELADMVAMIRELVDAAETRLRERRKRRPGRPATPAADIAKVLLLQAYLEVPNRVAQGLVLLFGEKLGLSREFSYKTIERGYDRRAVRRMLDEVFALTNEPVRGLERVLSVDGTGLPTSVKQNYERDARSKEGRGALGYMRAVAVIGTSFKLFAGWRSTEDPAGSELALFPDALREARAHQPGMAVVVGDGIYAGRPQCRLVGELGAVPRFLPRRNATLKRFGVREWVDMLQAMARDPQAWFADFHLRSLSETGFSVLKNRKGPLRKRLSVRKETEGFLDVVAHNIRRLNQLRYLAPYLPIPAFPAG